MFRIVQNIFDELVCEDCGEGARITAAQILNINKIYICWE
jgi:hypothetical protein